MNKKLKTVMLFIAIVVFTIFALSVKADVIEPGSDSDPLVTKSYVDNALSNLKQYIDANSSSGSSSSYEIVYLEENQQIVCSKGTEMILRSGIATIVDSDNGGLADVTSGKDLRMGENVPQNHLLIVPRDDGRGVKAENNYVILLVKGGYIVTE